jgi:hypothetical protein
MKSTIQEDMMSNEKEIHIIKTSETPSLSGKSTLTYQIGSNNDNEIFIKLAGNSGGGRYSPDWVTLEQVYTILSSQKEPITSGALQGLYQGESSNNASFTTALLLKEGLLKISPGNRHYDLVGQAEYKQITEGLLETATEEKPAKKRTGKKGKGVA